MAKKTGKVILWGLVIGAATAGAYHYFQNKEKAATADEFDDFEDAADDTQEKSRQYIPLNLDNAKAFVSDTIDKAKEAVSKVSRKLQKEDDVIIDDIFDDLDESADSAKETNAGSNTAEPSTAGESKDAPADDSATEDFFDDEQ